MLVVALTGGIGAGKSLVAQYFSELGARVVDADQLSRIAIERGSVGFDEVITRFGESVLRNGDIDRKALGEIVFKDKSAKADLEAIIHPRVRELFFEVVNDLAADEILIYEIPLLVETGAASNFDQIITVDGSGTKYEVGFVGLGINGNWATAEADATSVDFERMSNGQYLMTVTISLTSTPTSELANPVGDRGYDVAGAPKTITTRLLLNASKTQILAQAIYLPGSAVKAKG